MNIVPNDMMRFLRRCGSGDVVLWLTAQDDRRRDRENLAQGVVTVRYTNTEIEQHADRCAREVLEMIDSLCGLCAPRVDMGVPWESLCSDGCENPGEYDDIHEAYS